MNVCFSVFCNRAAYSLRAAQQAGRPLYELASRSTKAASVPIPLAKSVCLAVQFRPLFGHTSTPE